uniref:Serine/threonine-protein kinase Nek4 n=1 Tax=Scleropages formosus TaxID=113540 RepID=A0A8C9SHU7_SCLFO
MMEEYAFVRVVGKGSYGEVNLVKHRTDGKQYVIKKLNLRMSSKRERRAAEQEAQLLSQLRHPNIVTYRESWEGDDCHLYIVMGFCEGGDLYHKLKQQKGELLQERQVIEWFVQIAMALQYLHEKHILHRDLKTQNIFLTKTNIIKVGDLGIARVLENQNDMASTLIGTPYYMSPELFSNKPYNYKSDVWALGCCVYEMATLKHAFNAKDMNSLVYRIVEGKLPQMPSKYNPQLGELIKSMLSKKPEERPDVKQILRQPYIKRQIALFLEATKEYVSHQRGSPLPANVLILLTSRVSLNHSDHVLPFYLEMDDMSRQQSSEDDCSSSTSSTDRSEGDGKEGKSESCEMQDLVQLMTQTLRMDARDPSAEKTGSGAIVLPEFRLNRKYRDTLVLHGKTQQDQVDFRFSKVPSDTTSGLAKIMRVIEHLRTDVVKGLGIKLLDRVLEIMEEDDEEQRELCLREAMGEEKYKAYAVMVRQLKFFEDVASREWGTQ